MGNAIKGLLRSRKFLVAILTGVSDLAVFLLKDKLGEEVAVKLATAITTIGMVLIAAIAAEDMAAKIGSAKIGSAKKDG